MNVRPWTMRLERLCSSRSPLVLWAGPARCTSPQTEGWLCTSCRTASPEILVSKPTWVNSTEEQCCGLIFLKRQLALAWKNGWTASPLSSLSTERQPNPAAPLPAHRALHHHRWRAAVWRGRVHLLHLHHAGPHCASYCHRAGWVTATPQDMKSDTVISISSESEVHQAQDEQKSQFLELTSWEKMVLCYCPLEIYESYFFFKVWGNQMS